MGDEVIQGNWMGVGREVEECSDVDGTVKVKKKGFIRNVKLIKLRQRASWGKFL